MIAKPDAPTDGTRIDVTKRTNQWIRTEALKAETSQSLGDCPSLQPHREYWHDLSATTLLSYGSHQNYKLADFHNAVLRGRSSVAAKVPVSVANELERLVMEIKFHTRPEQ